MKPGQIPSRKRCSRRPNGLPPPENLRYQTYAVCTDLKYLCLATPSQSWRCNLKEEQTKRSNPKHV